MVETFDKATDLKNLQLVPVSFIVYSKSCFWNQV